MDLLRLKLASCLLCCCCGWVGAQNQPATAEALDLACACLEATTTQPLPPERLEPLLDSCLSEGLYRNLTGVLQEQGASLNNDSSLFALAQYFHTTLSQSCVGFRTITHGLAAQQLEVVKAENQQTKGILYDLQTTQQFPIVVLINQKYEAEQFLWLHEFDGSTRFMEGIKSHEHKEVVIVWKMVELYDVVTQRYRPYREILLIEEVGILSPKARRTWLKSYRQASKGKEK